MTKSPQSAVADVDRIYGYDGTPCIPIAGGSFIYPSACGVATVYPNAPADKTRFWGMGDGLHQITAIAMNRNQTCLVAAERRLKVNLYVYSYPNRKLLQQVPDAGRIEIADMAFSRDGNFLAVLSGPPTCSLSVYTVDSSSNRLTLYMNATPQFGHHLRRISFSPTNPEVICGSGGGHCVFWTMDTATVTMTALEGTVAMPNTRITSHQWMPDGSVVCGTTSAGMVHFTDLTAPVGTSVGPSVPHGQAVTIADTCLTKSHLITLTTEGTLSFYSTADVSSSHTLLPEHAAKVYETKVPKATFARIVPENNALVVGGSSGRLVYVALPGYSGDMQDDEFDVIVPKTAILQAGLGGSLVGIAHGKGTCVAAVAKTGLMTVIDYQANAIVSQINVGVEPIAVCGIPNTSSAAITSQTGCMRIVSFADPEAPKIIFKGRFSDTYMSLIATDPTGAHLAATDANNVYMFAVANEGTSITFNGCVRLVNNNGAGAMCFLPDSKGFLISHTTGDTVLMNIPTTEQFDANNAAGSDGLRTLEQSDLFVNSWRLDTPVYNLIVAAAYDDYLNVLTQSMDKAGRLYLFDRSLNPERKDRESRVIKAQVVNGDHDKKGTRVRVAFNKYVISAGADGKLCVRDGTNYLKPWTPQPLTKERTEPLSVAMCHASLRGGVSSFCAAYDSSRRIVSAGADGYVVVWNTPIAAIGAPPLQNNGLRVLLDVGHTPTVDEDDELYYTDKCRKEAAMVDGLRYQSYREGVQKHIDGLRTRLEVIRAENEAAAEDEKVELGDFLVQRQREAFEQTVSEAVDDMKEDVNLGNLRRDYLADLIKRECWDVMDVKLTPLVSLNTPDLVVYNFHQRKADAVDAALVRKLKFLRLVEEADRRHRKVHELEDVYDGVKVDPFVSGEAKGEAQAAAITSTAVAATSPTSADAPAEGAAANPEEETHKDYVEELTAKSILEQAADDPAPYLYNPLLVFTKSRSIIQKMLMTGRSQHLKNCFNKAFDDLVDRKHNELHHIKERNTRCKLILKELTETRDIYDPKMSPEEDPNIIFTVDESQVKADKSTDPDEKKRQAQLELERLRWIERNGTDGSSDKALKVWMDGRLDKDIRTLEINVPLPDFADETNVDKFVPLDERSDDQVRIFKEYETALQKRIDEVNLRREQLRAEFDKLQKQNIAAAKVFDEAVNALFFRRLIVSQYTNQVELSRVKLVQAVLMQDERLRIARKMEHRRKGLSDHLQRITKAVQKATTIYEKISGEVAARRDEEKVKERNIKTFAPFNDPEWGERLIKHYNRKLKAKRKAAAEAPPAEETKPHIHNPTQDPFAFIEIEQQLAQQAAAAAGNLSSGSTTPLPQHLSIAGVGAPDLASGGGHASSNFMSGHYGHTILAERPTGEFINIPEPIWQQYLAFRNDRAIAEQEINRMAAEQNEADQSLQTVQAQRAAIADAVTDAVRTFETFLRDSIEEQYDTDDVYTLQQGQVEIDQAPVVMNYDDAVMVRTSVANRLNGLIRESNQEKLAAMTERMMRLKDIAFYEWEVEFYVFAMRSLELQLKHLHTLRVTKQMQEFINGGGDDHNEIERKKLNIKIQHVRATMAEKIEDRRQQMQKLRRTIKDREVENYILQDQVGESKALVDDRRAIRDLQSSELDQMRSDRLMRDMRVTRKLEDVAKAQQSEMGTMKREIDRLRERTFPSFAVVSKRVVGNPDQM